MASEEMNRRKAAFTQAQPIHDNLAKRRHLPELRLFRTDNEDPLEAAKQFDRCEPVAKLSQHLSLHK